MSSADDSPSTHSSSKSVSWSFTSRKMKSWLSGIEQRMTMVGGLEKQVEKYEKELLCLKDSLENIPLCRGEPTSDVTLRSARRAMSRLYKAYGLMDRMVKQGGLLERSVFKTTGTRVSSRTS